jgi:hypothetical protein
MPLALLTLWLVLWLAACGAQSHAVRCSGPLQPINSPPTSQPSHRAVP